MNRALKTFTGMEIGKVSTLGWFGFAADPPTQAHRAVVDAALGSGLVERVIAFPAGPLPYKSFGASAWQRAEMAELWMNDSDWGDEVLLSRFDLFREQAMTWYELWQQLRKIAPKIKHILIVGSDQYGSISRSWWRGPELLRVADFIIVPREGYPLESVEKKHTLLNIDPIPGASTIAREGDLDQVDGRVRAYILEQHLYRTT